LHLFPRLAYLGIEPTPIGIDVRGGNSQAGRCRRDRSPGAARLVETMASATKASDSDRPVVVLAGWLGCRPRNLRRFVRMYDRMGWNALIRIGSPRSVVAAMTEGPPDSSPKSEMRCLAVDTLRELRRIQPPYFVLHLFSNNGCFLWEWMRHLLQPSRTSLNDCNADFLDLRQRLIGIIFDSAPAYYGGKTTALQSALQYVSPQKDRDHLLEITKTLDDRAVKERFDCFWNGLLDDSTDVPQMHLYAEVDALAPTEQLEGLIAYRRNKLGRNKIWSNKFSDSGHCRHLLKHPEEYELLVKRLLTLCTRVSADLPRKSRL
ncbi:hypothetical protein ACHAWF_008283, partial [Thalassiosira exigua]